MDSGSSALFFFGLFIVVGMAGGSLASRLRLPPLTGKILAGVLLALLLPESESLGRLQMGPVSSFALSLVAVTIGGHLEFRRLHNARKRILVITLVQTTLTFALVLGLFQALNPLGLGAGLRLPVHLLVASLATSTSPVAVIHMIKEKRARGLVVKTAIGVVAINNLLAILVFEVFNTYSLTLLAPEASAGGRAAGLAGLGVLIAVAVGALAGWCLDAYCRRVGAVPERAAGEPQDHYARHMAQGALFTGFVVAICMTAGLCEVLTQRFGRHGLHPSPILANMILGLVLANRSQFKEELLGLFDVLENAVFTSFFVMAGLHLHPASLPLAGTAVLVYFFARLAGKVGGGWLGGRLSGSTERVTRCTGPILVPQGALAVALLFVLEQTSAFAPYIPVIDALVVSACVLSELVGAHWSGRALERSGEALRARTRLIEFLQEEFIVPRLAARDKWEVLDKLSYFIAGSQTLPTPVDEVRRAVREREESMPTGIGHGIAVPHAKVSRGKDILGALAVLDPPVDFGAPDGEPARLVLMVVTPERSTRKHLEVISALMRMFSDARLRERVFRARTAEEIHEIIDSGEAETFNYFLET